MVDIEEAKEYFVSKAITNIKYATGDVLDLAFDVIDLPEYLPETSQGFYKKMIHHEDGDHWYSGIITSMYKWRYKGNSIFICASRIKTGNAIYTLDGLKFHIGNIDVPYFQKKELIKEFLIMFNQVHFFTDFNEAKSWIYQKRGLANNIGNFR